MRTILNDGRDMYSNANYVSNHIPKNVVISEHSKRHFNHKPYTLDFGKPVHNKETEMEYEDWIKQEKRFTMFANQ